jgi:hypothetical protein
LLLICACRRRCLGLEQPGLFGTGDLSPPLRPARLIVMETAGWAGLDPEDTGRLRRILAALRDADVEVLRRTDDPLIDAFERGIAEARAITTDICEWENRWSFENLVEQYPGKYSDVLYKRLEAGRRLSLTITACGCCSARKQRTGMPRSRHWPTR